MNGKKIERLFKRKAKPSFLYPNRETCILDWHKFLALPVCSAIDIHIVYRRE